jgi:hypothetical protein
MAGVYSFCPVTGLLTKIVQYLGKRQYYIDTAISTC